MSGPTFKKNFMTYFDLLKNVTRRTRFLLVFLMSLIGFSAAAGTYYADLNVAVNPADLDEGDKVVMCQSTPRHSLATTAAKSKPPLM